MGITISVLTIVKGRREALLNQIRGLEMNADTNMELIVVHMNEEDYPLPPVSFPLSSFRLLTEESLPLAKARNFAMSKASAEHCIFLDVDCIPEENFISSYRKAFAQQDVLWSGSVRYLSTNLLPDLHTTALQILSKADPIRGGLTTMPYELFWSLNFGCSKSVFGKIGGFDEQYMGYGAEDTDFAFVARANHVKLEMLNAIAYHQPHASYSPPLNHLEDIVSNASVFYRKWHQWPMEGWLTQFRDMGYISWDHDHLNILSYPEQAVLGTYLK